MRPKAARIIGIGAAAGASWMLASALPAGAQQAPTTVRFAPAEVGGTTASWVVPEGICDLSYVAAGAGGGSSLAERSGGRGARVAGDLALVPGSEVHVVLGVAGGDGSTAIAASDGRAPGGDGAALGGDSGSSGLPGIGAGGGGGATDVRLDGSAPSDRIVVAGGGGGAGASLGASIAGEGGEGGYGGLVGVDGGGGATDGGGKGGSAVAPGAGGDIDFYDPQHNGNPGVAGDGGQGGDGIVNEGTAPVYGGGGGGGGLFGGGGAAAGGPDNGLGNMDFNGGGGGGGSSWSASGVDATVTAGAGAAADEDGYVELAYLAGADCEVDGPLTGGPAPLAAAGATALGAWWFLRRRRSLASRPA